MEPSCNLAVVLVLPEASVGRAFARAGLELFLPVVVGIHVGEELVVHAASSTGGQPVVLRDESGPDKGCFKKTCNYKKKL